MRELPADVIMEYKEAFSLFDKDSDGLISHKEFSVVSRSLGLNPLEAEISELLELCAPSGMMDFPNFCLAMTQNKRLPDTSDDMMKAFYVFDKNNTGKIKATEMKTVLTSLGEILSEEECDQLLKTAYPDAEGYINYRDFTKRVFSQVN